MKKILKILGIILLLALAYGIYYAWRAFPIISGYGAKNLASAVFVQHRKAEDVLREDLGGMPFSLAKYTVNEADSSVTGSVWGFAKKKAIYRRGLGCTLINDITEEEIRAQKFNLPAPEQMSRDSVSWPMGDKLQDSISNTVDTLALQNAIDGAMAATSGNKPAYTRSVLVVYDGQIVGERYAPGFTKNTVMLGWSVSKSFTSALIGILVKEGKLNTEAPAPVPEWKGNDREKIKLRHLLQQTSGLDFEENYTTPSEVTNMLFRNGDMGAFTARRPLKHEPGTVFNYSSGNSNILSRIIRQTVGEASYASFPYTALFYKLGMYSTLLEPDASGTYIGSSYSYATTRDFARFGLLYYYGGKWNGEHILSPEWVRATVTPAPGDERKHYGYQFWLNGSSEGDLSRRWFPDVPADMFFAVGFGGQNIYIIPSKKLVVVRTGLQKIDENRFLKEVLAAIRS